MEKANEEIHILLVDDEPMLLSSLGTLLELEGYTIYKAEDGLKALEVIDETERIDFVLSDVKMPNLDGVELLDEIRKNRPSTPIVCLISGYADYSREELIKRGAIDIITKPYDFDLILQMIEENTK